MKGSCSSIIIIISSSTSKVPMAVVVVVVVCGGEKGQPTVVDLELSRNVAAAEESADDRLRLLRSPQHFTAKFLIGWRRGRRRQSRRRRRQGVLVERASITTGGRLGVGVFLSAGSDRYNKC